MLLLDTTRKPSMGSPMTRPHLTLNESSKLRSLRFQSIASRKGVKLGDILLLNIKRKACIESRLVRIHLMLGTLKDQC